MAGVKEDTEMDNYFMTVGMFSLYGTGIFFVSVLVVVVVGAALKSWRKANVQKQKSRETIRNMYFLLYGKDGIVEPVYDAVIDYTVDRNGRIKRTGDEIRQMQKEVRG
jgi:hypothetical protein